jgi:hypothetical protein
MDLTLFELGTRIGSGAVFYGRAGAASRSTVVSTRASLWEQHQPHPSGRKKTSNGNGFDQLRPGRAFCLHTSERYGSKARATAPPKPFIWHKTADQILDSVARFCKRINDSGH